MTTQEAQTIINNWKGSKDDSKYLEAKEFLEKKQSSTQDMKKDIKDVNTPKKQPKKSGVLKTLEEIGGAISRNQAGAGGAAMSNSQPSIQQVQEDQQIIDEISEATGLEKNKGLLKGSATDSKDVAQNLKDRGVAVTDEYKNKNPEVFNDFKVGNEANVKEEKESTKGGNSGEGSISSTGLDKHTQNYLNKNDKIAETVEEKQLKRLLENSEANWKQMTDTSAKVRNAYNDIDDKYIEQLPTFMFRRYQNGEFGDPKSGDAKLRFAHFLINGVGTTLANASHIIRKDGVQEQSEYEKVQGTNLEQGLANRWRKNNAETEEVIKIANKEADNEQDARIYVEQLTRDNMLKSGWNAMDQNQKLYAINVSREIGKMIGDMNVEELSNFITAQALNGNLSEQQAVVVGLASLVSKTPELLQKMPDGGIKNAVMSLLGIGQ